MTDGHARRRQATRERILDAAERLLQRGPADEASMDLIAAESAASVRTIYLHFGSRDGLLHAIGERLVAQHEAALLPAWTAGETAVERLRAVGEAQLGFFLERTERWWLLHDRAPSPDLDNREAGLLRRLEELAIEAGREEHWVADPLTIARYMWAAGSGMFAATRYSPGLRIDEGDLRELLAAGTDALLRGAQLGSARTERRR